MLALPVRAIAEDETGIVLTEGLGRDQAQASCSMCHSLDYIPMNTPILDRKGWEGSVNKMIKVMGAPVAEADIQKIVDYLTSQYGK